MAAIPTLQWKPSMMFAKASAPFVRHNLGANVPDPVAALTLLTQLPHPHHHPRPARLPPRLLCLRQTLLLSPSPSLAPLLSYPRVPHTQLYILRHIMTAFAPVRRLHKLGELPVHACFKIVRLTSEDSSTGVSGGTSGFATGTAGGTAGSTAGSTGTGASVPPVATGSPISPTASPSTTSPTSSQFTGAASRSYGSFAAAAVVAVGVVIAL